MFFACLCFSRLEKPNTLFKNRYGFERSLCPIGNSYTFLWKSFLCLQSKKSQWCDSNFRGTYEMETKRSKIRRPGSACPVVILCRIENPNSKSRNPTCKIQYQKPTQKELLHNGPNSKIQIQKSQIRTPKAGQKIWFLDFGLENLSFWIPDFELFWITPFIDTSSPS